MIADRRLETRSRIYQPARLVFNGEQSVFTCTVRNRSQTGAMVRLADWVELPGTFELDVPNGDSRRVRQCWRRGDDVGVDVSGKLIAVKKVRIPTHTATALTRLPPPCDHAHADSVVPRPLSALPHAHSESPAH